MRAFQFEREHKVKRHIAAGGSIDGETRAYAELIAKIFPGKCAVWHVDRLQNLRRVVMMI